MQSLLRKYDSSSNTPPAGMAATRHGEVLSISLFLTRFPSYFKKGRPDLCVVGSGEQGLPLRKFSARRVNCSVCLSERPLTISEWPIAISEWSGP